MVPDSEHVLVLFFYHLFALVDEKELPTSIQKPTKIDKVSRIALERYVDVAMLCVKRIPGQFKVADEVNKQVLYII